MKSILNNKEENVHRFVVRGELLKKELGIEKIEIEKMREREKERKRERDKEIEREKEREREKKEREKKIFHRNMTEKVCQKQHYRKGVTEKA